MKKIHHIRLIILEAALLIAIAVLLRRHFEHHVIEWREQPTFQVTESNATYRVFFGLRDDGQVSWKKEK